MESELREKFELRKAVIADADALRDCMVAAYSAYLETLKGISLPPLEVDYATEISENPTWVAEHEGEIVGGLIMTFTSSAAMISNVAVHPIAQSNGVGRRLLDFAGQQAKEKGFTRMRLATHVLLKQNVSLYQHLGWEIVAQDSVRVTMEKSVM